MKKFVLCALLFFSFSVCAEDLIKYTYRMKNYSAKEELTGWGTAVAVDLSAYKLEGKRYLMTAAHLVPADRDILIDMPVGWIRCKVVKRDDDFDVAVLECSIDLPDVAILDTEKDIAIGTELENVGCPKSNPPKQVKGKLEEKHMNWKAPFPGFYHGSSGSPVFHDGKLFGIATGGEANNKGEMVEGIGYFLPLRRLLQFLSE